jgi:hypothetical protein
VAESSTIDATALETEIAKRLPALLDEKPDEAVRASELLEVPYVSMIKCKRLKLISLNLSATPTIATRWQVKDFPSFPYIFIFIYMLYSTILNTCARFAIKIHKWQMGDSQSTTPHETDVL